jgi:hypothetical protein
MLSRIMKSVIATALVVLLVTVTACGTIQYRDIQGEFVEAVSADNAWSVSPLGASAAEGLYSSILVQLTDEYIAKLDDRLKLNAWLLRAVSEWRLGKFSNARVSVVNGLREKQPNQDHSRDHVMLAMLNGLIIDSDRLPKYQGLTSDSPNKTITLGKYESEFSPDFKTALDALDEGYKQAGPATPQEVGWYYNYHRWRIIQNWRSVVNSIEPQESRESAKNDAQDKLGNKFRKTMDAERDEIPSGHPLRELIRAQGGG